MKKIVALLLVVMSAGCTAHFNNHNVLVSDSQLRSSYWRQDEAVVDLPPGLVFLGKERIPNPQGGGMIIQYFFSNDEQTRTFMYYGYTTPKSSKASFDCDSYANAPFMCRLQSSVIRDDDVKSTSREYFSTMEHAGTVYVFKTINVVKDSSFFSFSYIEEPQPGDPLSNIPGNDTLIGLEHEKYFKSFSARADEVFKGIDLYRSSTQ